MVTSSCCLKTMHFVIHIFVLYIHLISFYKRTTVSKLLDPNGLKYFHYQQQDYYTYKKHGYKNTFSSNLLFLEWLAIISLYPKTDGVQFFWYRLYSKKCKYVSNKFYFILFFFIWHRLLVHIQFHLTSIRILSNIQRCKVPSGHLMKVKFSITFRNMISKRLSILKGSFYPFWSGISNVIMLTFQM